MAEPRTDREQRIETKQSSGNRQMTTTPDQGAQQGSQQLRRRSAADNPFDLLRRLTEQMFGVGMLPRAPEVWSPNIQVFERDGKLKVTADLPGMSRDDVRVELRDNNLVLEGERKEERKEDREGYFVSERSYGSFHRVIPLPDDVDAGSARATFRDGVLELTFDLPRNHQSHSRSIPIEEGREEGRGRTS
jgi:HSP20 family protein